MCSPRCPQHVAVVVVKLVVDVHRFPAAGLVLALVRRLNYVRWCFDENDIPALDYLARLRVVSAGSLKFPPVTAEPAVPGFVTQLVGVGLEWTKALAPIILRRLKSVSLR